MNVVSPKNTQDAGWPSNEGLGSTCPTKNGIILVVTITGVGEVDPTYTFQNVILVDDCYMLELNPGKFTYFEAQKLGGWML